MAATTVNAEEFRFDFAAEIEQLIDPAAIVEQHSGVSIWGGEFEADEQADNLADFLAAWSFAGMPNRIWEYAHRIEFVKDQPLNAAERRLLDRARLFGMSGDLSLRRDGGHFLWHFIGASSVALPEEFGAQDFWVAHSGTKLRRWADETALLWGKGKQQDDGSYKDWQDDRVGWATLAYPGMTAERVQLVYELFTEDGQPAFVWWKELQPYV